MTARAISASSRSEGSRPTSEGSSARAASRSPRSSAAPISEATCPRARPATADHVAAAVERTSAPAAAAPAAPARACTRPADRSSRYSRASTACITRPKAATGWTASGGSPTSWSATIPAATASPRLTSASPLRRGHEEGHGLRDHTGRAEHVTGHAADPPAGEEGHPTAGRHADGDGQLGLATAGEGAEGDGEDEAGQPAEAPVPTAEGGDEPALAAGVGQGAGGDGHHRARPAPPAGEEEHVGRHRGEAREPQEQGPGDDRDAEGPHVRTGHDLEPAAPVGVGQEPVGAVGQPVDVEHPRER